MSRQLLIVSRLLYALPLVGLGRPQWYNIDTLHRIAQRLCLGVLSFTSNTATLTEGQDMPLQHHDEERAFRHVKRMSQPFSTVGIYQRVISRSSSHLGHLAEQFQERFGKPSVLPQPISPHDLTPPLNIHERIVRLDKSDFPDVVCRAFVADLLETPFPYFLLLYADGFVDNLRRTATAACHVPSLGVNLSGHLNYSTTSTTTEFCAIRLTLQYLFHPRPHKKWLC